MNIYQTRESGSTSKSTSRIILGIAACLFSVVAAFWATGVANGGGVFRPLNDSSLIEPQAGTWKTWVLTSGSQVRLPAPPDKVATEAEMKELRALAEKRDATARDQVAFWDAGAPSYRWMEMALAQAQKKALSHQRITRLLALMNVAIYDATIAAWDSKYTYNRPRPGELANDFATLIATPRSPSYPSEHAVTAGAAAAILAYVFPEDAQSFNDQANQAAQSRLIAGVQYPSDVKAGLEVGRAVAALVIERAKTDGSDAKWTGTVATGPGMWSGTNPVEPLAGTWKTWVLTSPSQFRPGPPPAFNSPQKLAEITELKTITRTFSTNARAFFWQTFEGVYSFYAMANQRLFEYHLDTNAPRAARVYALLSVTQYDASVACWDAKYTYWAIRPSQLDPAVTTLFPNPNHPSYPSAHGCFSGSIAATLAYLFPREAKSINAAADEAAESRVWAGIHYRSDIVAGLALGRAVSAQVVERAQNDGSQSQ